MRASKSLEERGEIPQMPSLRHGKEAGEEQETRSLKPHYIDRSAYAGQRTGILIDSVKEEELPAIFERVTEDWRFREAFGRVLSEREAPVALPGFYTKLLKSVEQDTYSTFAHQAAVHVGRVFHALTKEEKGAYMQSVLTKPQMNKSPFAKQFVGGLLSHSLRHFSTEDQVDFLELVEGNPKSTLSAVALLALPEKFKDLSESALFWVVKQVGERPASNLNVILRGGVLPNFRNIGSKNQGVLLEEFGRNPNSGLAGFAGGCFGMCYYALEPELRAKIESISERNPDSLFAKKLGAAGEKWPIGRVNYHRNPRLDAPVHRIPTQP